MTATTIHDVDDLARLLDSWELSLRLRDVAPCFTLAEQRVLDLARRRTWP